MNTLGNFTTQKPRQLPVIVAVDRSGSMYADGKIDALNTALRNFVDSVKKETSSRAEINLALYSFGGTTASLDLPLTPISAVGDVPVYEASGMTPMGEAFEMIKTLIEDRDAITSRAYKPTIVLITDGYPNDDWKSKMDVLINDGRSSKAFRMAMAIGDDADTDMLRSFVSTPEYLVRGENARDIKKFFRYVTMSVTSRMKSQTPDQVQVLDYPSDDEVLEF